ncbi:MAG: hypothetical protein ACRD3J_09045 [Thermoanaerobaculia bacterium]
MACFLALAIGSRMTEPTRLAQADIYVNGYTRSDGRNVQPHHQTAPDGNPYNNYGFPGNNNPNTGKRSPGNPDTYLRNHDNGGSTFGMKPQNPYIR